MLYEVEFQFAGKDSMNATLTGPALVQATDDLAEGKPAIIGKEDGYSIVFPHNLTVIQVEEVHVDC